MDLASNNLQRLICHKTQQTKPPILHKIDIRKVIGHKIKTNRQPVVVGYEALERKPHYR